MYKYAGLLLIILTISCKSNKNNFKRDNSSSENKEYISTHISATLEDSNEESKFVQISKAKILGNKLILKIGYSGGCSPHEFKFTGSKMISKSMPPIRNVRLIHKTEDMCREYIETELVVDISSLAYIKKSGSKIKLNIEGYQQLLYTYE